jgi:hypothetical protein
LMMIWVDAPSAHTCDTMTSAMADPSLVGAGVAAGLPI